MFHDWYSFKLHETSRQLHEWTRSEKMKLKEQTAEAAKGERCHGEKPSTTDVQGAEPFEGEMDDFQTPLVRRGLLPFFYVSSRR
jgi:hypothetical protein